MTRFRSIVISLVLVLSARVHASDDQGRTPMTLLPPLLSVTRERARAKRMEHVGEWLTGVGLVHLGAAIPLLLFATVPVESCTQPRLCNEGSGFLLFPTIGLSAASAVLLGIGIPLWTVGHARHRRIERAVPVVGLDGQRGAR